MTNILKRLRGVFKKVGPGVITGAADDDPSGIATYSQTGAQFGYGQLWTAVFMLPFMISVQEACARVGAVTGKGVAAVVKENYSRKILFALVTLVLIANTINIGADIGAMAAAAKLLVPLPFIVLALFFTIVILLLEIFVSYRTYSKILKWLAVSLLAYPITVFMVEQPWGTILRATFIPNIELNFAFLFIITGVLGTTISPYMFFWQASEEVEEERAHHINSHDSDPSVMKKFLHNLRIDTFFGMLFSETATWSIIVVAATILHTNGVTDIRTAADAARALEPLVQGFPNAGLWAKGIFATGIIGLGLLGVPVLAGSAAYALSEALNWREGLGHKFNRARGFYAIIIIATLIGLLMNFIGIDPMKALVYTAVFNGIAAAPLIFFIARIAESEKVMGVYKSGPVSRILVWLTCLTMATASNSLLFTLSR